MLPVRKKADREIINNKKTSFDHKTMIESANKTNIKPSKKLNLNHSFKSNISQFLNNSFYPEDFKF